MPRRPLLLTATAVATLLATTAVVPVSGAKPKAVTNASVEFKLVANHGLHAHIETSADEVTLEITRKGRLVSYRVKGEITETGLRARFGTLGLIDVAFRPTKTLSTTEPPRECEGEPWTRREGFFAGTIEFTGEREYVRVEASRAKGLMSVTPEWQCDHHTGPIRPPAPRAPGPGFPGDFEPEPEPAEMSVFSHRCRCGFVAVAIRGSKGKGPNIFSGAKVESREGMRIGRATVVHAGASAFVFDHRAGTATLRPPPPFSGNGTFERRPHGHSLWRSTIRVPLLGTDPVSFRGRSFRARLRRDFPGD